MKKARLFTEENMALSLEASPVMYWQSASEAACAAQTIFHICILQATMPERFS